MTSIGYQRFSLKLEICRHILTLVYECQENCLVQLDFKPSYNIFAIEKVNTGTNGFVQDWNELIGFIAMWVEKNIHTGAVSGDPQRLAPLL